MNNVDFLNLANHFLRDLKPYQPGKPIEELERELKIKNAIKLASNENPLGPSPLAIKAIAGIMEKAHFYPDGSCYELKQSLSHYLKVDSNQITIGNGSENILELVVKAFSHTKSNVIISQHAFLTIPIILKSYGITIKTVPEIIWRHDVAGMIKALDEQTKIIFIVNPNNPTGTYINDNEFELLMSAVPETVLVVMDEAYFEYMDALDYPQTQKYLHLYPNLIITRTFSKVYGLAALRVGYAISSKTVADILNRVRLPFNVNSIAAKAASAALSDRSHVEESVRLTQKGRKQITTVLQALTLPYIATNGNFITLNVGNGLIIYEKLLREGVIVRPLQAYGMPEYIRVTIGTYLQNERFLSSLIKVLTS